ncbi:hypothetical protein [Agrobacterium sp. B1(2019)]|uniref:hypothetical protein n=1 Tax=Agrobacterium sp. B1(2019) TaxID=2607032 RepID=UPI0016593B3E|nr:hypothetical protein [Agrobacterium sp. B1(2019)]
MPTTDQVELSLRRVAREYVVNEASLPPNTEMPPAWDAFVGGVGHRKAINEALRAALMLENQRTIDTARSDDFLPIIKDEMMKVRAGVFANFKSSNLEK